MVEEGQLSRPGNPRRGVDRLMEAWREMVGLDPPKIEGELRDVFCT